MGLIIMRKIVLSATVALLIAVIILYVFSLQQEKEQIVPSHTAETPEKLVSDNISNVESSEFDEHLTEQQLQEQRYEEAQDRFSRLYEREKKLGITPKRSEPLEFDLKAQMPPDLKQQ